jgi:hypothetical protein
MTFDSSLLRLTNNPSTTRESGTGESHERSRRAVYSRRIKGELEAFDVW